MSVIVWFRKDLRVQDNPALAAALKSEQSILALFIWDPQSEGEWMPGAASRWWLHHALINLENQLAKFGISLHVVVGDTTKTLVRLADQNNTTSVYWNRCFEPTIIARDVKIKSALAKNSIQVESFNGSLLFDPAVLRNKSSKPFRVYTPFWKHCVSLGFSAPLAIKTKTIPPAKTAIKSVSVDALKLLPSIAWDKRFYEVWPTKHSDALTQFDLFNDSTLSLYHEQRDSPSIPGTSRLSPLLHWGQVSPRQIIHWVSQQHDIQDPGAQTFVKQILWREFAYHLLFHFPHTCTQPLNDSFQHFPWKKNKKLMQTWQRGETGYPIVDAGMRQLWISGWMHNRVRMIVASFLVKHLLQPWLEGARWFWETLVDADLANNTMGWQWTAGCGADASPFFRIFNPLRQGQKFDADGMYIRQWLPELQHLPNKLIHSPWLADQKTLQQAGITLGKHYPKPIVDLDAGRIRALNAYKQIKNA